MKITTGKFGPHFGWGFLKITVLASLALGIALTLTLTPGSASGEGQDELVAPIDLEEGRIAPVLIEPPSVPEPPQVRQVVEPPSVLKENQGAPKDVQRQVQGKGVSITQTSSTLISNLGQGNGSSDIDLNNDHAQWFGTGSDSQGYKLTGVKMIMKSTVAKPSYTVSIWSGDANPSTKEGDLVNPTLTSTWSTVDFAATGSGIDLTRNKTYWVVIDSSVSNADTDIRVTGSDDEDSGGALGWSIGNVRRYRPFGNNNWGTTLDSNVVKIAISGYTKTVLTSAEVNGTSLVLTFDKDLDTASRTAARQFGIRFGGSGGELQRATAISISGRQVTLTVPEVRAGQVVTVSYTVPTSNPLKGSNGAGVDAFSDQAVTVNTGPAYGRLPESGKVRTAIYVTYTNAEGRPETVENRAASADRETLLDYFEDECRRTGQANRFGIAHPTSYT